MIRGLVHLSCEERLRKLWLFSLERRLGADLKLAFQYLKDEDKHFSKACCDMTSGNGFKVDDEFRFGVR